MKNESGPSMKRLVATLWLLLTAIALQGQQSPAGGDFLDRVRFGGGLGLAFGNRSTQISLAPSAIYMASDILAFGVGANYTYARFDDARLSAFGGSLISLVNPIPQVQLSAEFEQLRVKRTLEAVPEDLRDSYWLPALYLGAGYRTGPVTFGIRYDVLYRSSRSLYSSPWLPFVRVYF
ncbi:alpha-ketoglutarate decarboxylase [Robiginitalea sp. SC105]|uniref:alpha-ketoglutarate decarboxylase n=1 Tax=Robiginitalea sp. SC105 TaxID=2762332 RepID=UPI00163B2077|nr:alpha-ketoglutarate decarboxylase [Robiginitalea sp. SC105]MBC2838715.1 alpha-ketoglutarate decarboxylase [Robiginitalea sp. SC105]